MSQESLMITTTVSGKPLANNILDLITRNKGIQKQKILQSGASSRAKIGGAYSAGVTGSIQDPITVPGPCEVTEF